nr:MAG TPA: hypothetical protein [Caudoviricetes sp.]
MVFHKGDFIRHKSTLINGEKEVTVYSCDHLRDPIRHLNMTMYVINPRCPMIRTPRILAYMTSSTYKD